MCVCLVMYVGSFGGVRAAIEEYYEIGRAASYLLNIRY